MSRWSSLILFVVAAALVVETFAASDEPIIVRSKRQQCRCVKNPNGGLTCSCAKGPADASSNSAYNAMHDVPQSADIANQLTAIQQRAPGQGQARCGCIQIVIQGVPQYNCQCGDQNGNPLPTTTTVAPTTTTTTTTTMRPTTTSTTTTTTPRPIWSEPNTVPTYTQGPNNGACNCIMISISSPQTAQYQCQCANPQQQQQTYDDAYNVPGTLPSLTYTSTASPTTTTTTTPSTTTAAPIAPMVTLAPPAVYPAAATVHTDQPSCYCVDPVTHTMSGYCGCTCNCVQLLVSTPNAVCGCPQAHAYPSEPIDYTQVFPNQPAVTTPIPTTTTPTTTMAPTTTTTTTRAPTTAAYYEPQQAENTQYPLTTTCVMYVNVPTTVCSCLPQYDQCATNVCCLKAKYRSYKKVEEKQDSTIDMLMNVLKTIKTKLE
ncbi:unnamed protein product [Caenorhabditis bovis]|uniref:Uncharacterized protein n=1 Tax=Caenorhabditis bovis TaxID=2654633 RepID=A0A8S1F547_9PELO|nr:unnamed protein product [Caenorhabditis bovis]